MKGDGNGDGTLSLLVVMQLIKASNIGIPKKIMRRMFKVSREKALI